MTRRYYVMLPDGNRHGPVDVATLRQWGEQKLIRANTVLEEEATGMKMPAGLVPELGEIFQQQDRLEQGSPPPKVKGSVSQQRKSQAITALLFAILGILCCGLLCIPAITMAKEEFQNIEKGLVSEEHMGVANAAYYLALAGIAIWVIGIAIAIFIGAQVFMVSEGAYPRGW